jgi:hypothetical protein
MFLIRLDALDARLADARKAINGPGIERSCAHGRERISPSRSTSRSRR